MVEFLMLVILPAGAIGLIALIAMVVLYRNPSTRHLVGPDAELRPRRAVVE